MNEVYIALITLVGVLVPSILLHIREIKKKDDKIQKLTDEKETHRIKADVLDRILDFSAFNQIKLAVDEIFETTVADRFLILIAVNGKVDFNIVSVIFEQHKESKYQVSAIARYKSLNVDDLYRAMLKSSERNGIIELETATMPNCLLKDIYQIEKVTFSDVRHLLRYPADKDNDILIYSSLATHNENGFSKLGKTKANIIYDSQIKQILKNVISKN